MKKVLVTGATGFIGGYVIEKLLKDGFEVIASSSDRTKAENKAWLEKVKYVEFDLRLFNPDENYFNYFGNPDMMIHLAWEGLPDFKGDFHIKDNLPRHQLFLRNMLSSGLSDLTVTGTCLEYGLIEGCLSENLECKPITAYGAAKDALRKYLELLKTEYSFNLKWVRLFYMYGDGQSAKSLFSQLDAALDRGDTIFNMSAGEQERDYLHVNKAAEKLVAITAQNKITGILNCASGKPVKVKDLVTDYLRNKGRSIILNLGFYSYPDYEPMRFWGDDSKLIKIINNYDS